MSNFKEGLQNRQELLEECEAIADIWSTALKQNGNPLYGKLSDHLPYLPLPRKVFRIIHDIELLRAQNLKGPLLEVGSGTGKISVILAELLEVPVVGIDIRPNLVQAANRALKNYSPSNGSLNVRFVHGNFFPDGFHHADPETDKLVESIQQQGHEVTHPINLKDFSIIYFYGYTPLTLPVLRLAEEQFQSGALLYIAGIRLNPNLTHSLNRLNLRTLKDCGTLFQKK